MIVSVKHRLLLSLALASVAVTSPALAQRSLPPLPAGPGGNATPAAAQAAPAAPTAQQLYEHVRRGLVVLQKNGLPVAIGTVLGTDGRILTALSGLGGTDGADVLYADGTTVHAKLDQSDKGQDLALLAPQGNAQASKWASGLAASAVDPATAVIRAMVPTKGARLAPAEADVKGKADAHGHDGQPLQQMLDVAVKGPLFAGAPLLDSSGDVVAVLVKACKGAAAAGAAPGADAWAAWGSAPQPAAKAAACSPVVVAAPVAAIRSFLTASPGAAAAPAAATPAAAPWLGIRGEPQAAGSVHGVHVLAVAPQSPAEASGLAPSTDIIAAVDGESVETPQKLSERIGKHAVGDTVKLLVFGQGKFREVTVVLRAAP
jgi:serine protease Do